MHPLVTQEHFFPTFGWRPSGVASTQSVNTKEQKPGPEIKSQILFFLEIYAALTIPAMVILL
jgi:hypothetical protein